MHDDSRLPPVAASGKRRKATKRGTKKRKATPKSKKRQPTKKKVAKRGTAKKRQPAKKRVGGSRSKDRAVRSQHPKKHTATKPAKAKKGRKGAPKKRPPSKRRVRKAGVKAVATGPKKRGKKAATAKKRARATPAKKKPFKAGAPTPARKKRKKAAKRPTKLKPPPKKPAKRQPPKRWKPPPKPDPDEAPKPAKRRRIKGEILRPVIQVSGPVVSAEESAPPGPALSGQVRIPHVLAPNVYYVSLARLDDYSEDDGGEDVPRYMTSTSGMHMHNDNYLELFRQSFLDYLHKTKFEDIDDIPFYRFGMIVRSLKPRTPEAIGRLVYKIRDFMVEMMPQGASCHIVDEDRYIAVRMALGHYRRPTVFSRAYEYLKRNRELMIGFKRSMMDFLGDCVWFEFWDTEENYAHSP